MDILNSSMAQKAYWRYLVRDRSQLYIISRPGEKAIRCFMCSHHSLLCGKLSLKLVPSDKNKNSFVQILWVSNSVSLNAQVLWKRLCASHLLIINRCSKQVTWPKPEYCGRELHKTVDRGKHNLLGHCSNNQPQYPSPQYRKIWRFHARKWNKYLIWSFYWSVSSAYKLFMW